MHPKKPCAGSNEDGVQNESRRDFFKQTSLLTALALTPAALLKANDNGTYEQVADTFEKIPVSIEVNGIVRNVTIDPRVTLLDVLREELGMTGTKKGCDRGQCGACTVHADGVRINSCLSLAVSNEGKKITTIEGLANGDVLHPMQEAFILHDGFQCGYCTPGQIMSAVALIKEGHTGSDDEIREFMSGNICRCGAYTNIVKAIKDAQKNISAS